MIKKGIAVRIAVIFSGLLLLATSTAGYMVYQEARHSLIHSSTERLAHTAEVIRVRTFASVEAITKDVRFLASTPPVRGIVRARVKRGLDPETALLDSEWREQLADLFRVFLENRPSYLKVSFSDVRAAPRVLVSVGKDVNEGQRVFGGPHGPLDDIFPRDTVLTRGYVYLSDIELVTDSDTGERIPMMYAALPVFEEEASLFGVVTVSIDLRELLESVTGVVGPDKSLFVANAQGELLARPSGPYMMEQARGRRIHDVFTTKAIQNRNVQFVEQRRDDGGERVPGIAYFDRLRYDALDSKRQVIVAVVSPNATILEAVNNVEKRSVLIVLFFSIGGALIALGLSRFVTRPLSHITDAIGRFGEEAWNVELPTSRSDEIGVLARAFDKMAKHINYQLGALEERERHQRIILETAAEGIIVADGRGVVETMNPAAERLFGYDAEEIVGARVGMLLPSRVQNAENEDAMSWRDVGTGHEVVGRREDGTDIPVSLSVSEFVFEKETRYTLFLEDITERKEYEEALHVAKEKAEEMANLKTAFLANMSHELRTPLTAVIGYASMLADELSERHEHFAQLIERSGRRLMDTLNAVLSLAQLESQQMNVQLDALDVAEEVEETARFFETHAAGKGLAFRCIISPSSRGILARLDRGALNSVLQNIIGNAIKFTDSGFVEVRVHATADRVGIAVRDTGVGIEETFLPHLFDAFRQESTGMHRSYEGSGLGLALTKKLVDLMDGDIEVKSVKEEGTIFTISFPKAGTAHVRSRGTEEGADPADPSAFVQGRILVVEDNPDTALMVRRILGVAGDVTLAFDGEEALRKIERTTFDLILCDVNLGAGVSGTEVMKEVKQDRRYESVPVLALTAYALPGDRERFLELGFDEYIGKPFAPDDLLTTVYGLLNRRGFGRNPANGGIPKRLPSHIDRR